MTVRTVFVVNGCTYDIEIEAGETLLRTLRDRLLLTGTKDGCSEGECGACTVLVDGVPLDSCLLSSLAVAASEITTIEGIGGSDGNLSRVQEAMVATGAIQCGFCTPGFVMTLTALLARNPTPNDTEIRCALAGNICRCTGYSQIVDAVMSVIRTRT